MGPDLRWEDSEPIVPRFVPKARSYAVRSLTVSHAVQSRSRDFAGFSCARSTFVRSHRTECSRRMNRTYGFGQANQRIDGGKSCRCIRPVASFNLACIVFTLHTFHTCFTRRSTEGTVLEITQEETMYFYICLKIFHKEWQLYFYVFYWMRLQNTKYHWNYECCQWPITVCIGLLLSVGITPYKASNEWQLLCVRIRLVGIHTLMMGVVSETSFLHVRQTVIARDGEMCVQLC